MTPSQLTNWFAYREGTPEQNERCVKIRTAVFKAAETFAEHSDVSADQTYALRKLKDALQAMIATVVAPMPR